MDGMIRSNDNHDTKSTKKSNVGLEPRIKLE